MNKEQKPQQQQRTNRQPHNQHTLWKKNDIFASWAETKAMVDAGYTAFWERRGMTPPNNMRRSF